LSDKKYQVFISSTYIDLIEERKAVEETIIRSGDFPVGMEAFPAADEEQFEFIKTVILKCDYYILIIGGRYGSIAEDGLSYTEKEFDYALENGIPVLLMLRANRHLLGLDKSEGSPEGREKLESFIAKASSGRLRKEWEAKADLKLAVREALDYAKATKPRPGWIRGDKEANSEVLAENIALRKDLDILRGKVKELTPKLDDIAGLDTPITVIGTRMVEVIARGRSTGTPRKESWEAVTDFSSIYSLIAPSLVKCPSDYDANTTIAKTVCEMIGKSRGTSHRVSEQIFNKIKLQLEALGLIEVRRAQTTQGNYGVFWFLTPLGKVKMLELGVVRKSSEAN